jgi:hypothetical protein
MLIALTLAVLVFAQVPTAGYSRPDVELLKAAKAADVMRARQLVASGAPVDAADWRGYTPLMWSAAAGHGEMTRYLIESGAFVDSRAADGTTALMLAAANGTTAIVELLLTRGANPAAVRGGLTARQLALSRGHVEAATVLESAEVLGQQLLQAASEGQGMTVRQLLARGAPPNISGAGGVSPLMFAARNGDLGTLQYLLSRGADPLVRDQQGQSAIEWADRSPATRQHVVAFLRERTARNTAAAAAPRAAPAVPASLKEIESLLARAAAPAGPARNAQRRAAAAVSALIALSRSWPAQTPEDYRTNLAADAAALAAAVDGGEPAVLRQSLEAIADDLEAKLEHCRKSGGKLGGSVLVRVRTVQGGEEARKWQVLYMPRIFEASPTAVPDLFPQLSSPTEETLVPGRYLMWVRNPATAKLGERTLVRVGEGRKELIVDLPVPADAVK